LQAWEITVGDFECLELEPDDFIVIAQLGGG